MKAAIISSAVASALVTTSLAVAAGEGRPLDGGQRNPSSGALTRETQVIARNSTYATRQSNLSTTGGGAVYGCRARTGSVACLRGSNLNDGLAFSFGTRGGTAGRIEATGGESARPFTTNATAVATGLNADRVDGRDAQQIVDAAVGAARSRAGLDADTVDGIDGAALRTRWVLVNAAGEIEAQSGGFRIIAAYPAGTPAAPNVYIGAGEDLRDNGIQATLALQNQVNQGGGTATGNDAASDQNLEFSGEVTASRCQIPGVVECGPAGAKNVNAFVVSPRLSDGQPTTADTRKRFYVTITE